MPLVLLPVTLIILARKIIEISVIENVKLREMKNFSTLIMKSWRLFSRRTQIHQKIIPDLELSGMFMIDQIQLHHHHQTVSHPIYHTLPYQPISTSYYMNPPHRPTHHANLTIYHTSLLHQLTTQDLHVNLVPANVLQRWTSEKLTHNIWGIFRFARTYVTCSQQQIKAKQCHNRHKIQRANRGKHRFIEAQRLLSHTQNYQPRNCVRGKFFVFISFLSVTSCLF